MRKAGLCVGAALVLAALAAAGPISARPTSTPATGRYIVIAKSSSDYAALQNDLAKAGQKVVLSLPDVNASVIVTTAKAPSVAAVASNAHVKTVVPDRIETIVPPNLKQELLGPSQTRYQITKKQGMLTADPAFSLGGLLWNVKRIDDPAALKVTTGHGITVGVADTGLDYTHLELHHQVSSVVDFTQEEDPVICNPDDHHLAAMLGAPADDLDFNGHGSWIGGNIAAELNGTGINGTAPGVSLVSLKISGWCGSAYDSTIIHAFLYAASHGIDVVSISFGGYLDRSDHDQDAIYGLYEDAVQTAHDHGTVIVAAAGNEHTEIGAGGLVLSHGILSVPPGGDDLFGLYEVPGGLPGVVDVSSTNNITRGKSHSCPADAINAGGFSWCKPSTDAHQPFGVGLQNQLTYYSNYGPRIDVAGPGGARKFNLPAADRGGTPGWPYTGANSLFGGTSTSDGYRAFEDFSITSNWAQEIPCFTFTGFSQFPTDQCYSTIQGTSMATPHASAVLALIAASHHQWRHNVDALVAQLKATAEDVSGNKEPPVSDDTSPADLTGAACPGGFCHLGGAAIPDSEAYGAGLVDADEAVQP